MLAERWGERWTEQEIRMLKSDQTAEQLAKRLSRTPSAIRSKRYVMGICDRYIWDAESLHYLQCAKAKGKPFKLVFDGLQKLCKRNGFSIPSYFCAYKKYREIQVIQEYFTPSELASLLGITSKKVLNWLALYKDVLKPVQYGGCVQIEVKRFREFCREYPGEIAKAVSQDCLLWLLTCLLVK